MSFRFPQPSNEDDFELFCLRLVQELWRCQTLQQYGKRGERQNGIDLIDESGGTPLRAVQCKHHEPDKTIPPAEIGAEVALAVASGLALDEYYILTSARKTIHSQNALIKINRDHAARGQFKVHLWTWADIETKLSELDDVTQDKVLRGDSGRGGPALPRLLSGLMGEHFDRPLYASASVLDTELDVVEGAIKRFEFEVAEAKLKELETRAADKLQPHHWYHLKTLRSRIYSARWQWNQAGRELLDAKRHTPTTDRAKINEALGYELLGDREKAHEIASRLRLELPQSVRLLSIWVRTASPTADFGSIVDIAAPLAKEDEELSLALAHRAISANRFADAIPYAQRATEIDADSPHAWFVLGQAKHASSYTAVSGPHAAGLNEAQEFYNRAATLARAQKLPGLEATIRFNRGKVRHLLGDNRAEVDYVAAIELAHPEQGLRTEYAGFLLEAGRPGDALRELEAVEVKSAGSHLFYEAAARYGRNQGDDWSRADALLRQLITSEPAGRWADAFIMLVQRAIERKTQPTARAVLAGSKLNQVDPFVYRTLNGWLADSEGNAQAARAEYDEALLTYAPETPRDHVFLLAQALVAADEDQKALPLLERCYRPGVFNLECRKLLTCAQRLGRHNVSVRVCHELRQAGEADPRIVQTEISILQLYDPHAALGIARDYLARNPDDRHVALWQSTLALRLDRSDLLIADVARLPTPDALTPEGGSMVVSILAEDGQYAAALQYSYEILSNHFSAEFAHGHYLAQFLTLSPHCTYLQIAGVANIGMAVGYQEEHEQIDRWVVLEDSADANLSFGELAPDHPVSRALTGKKVGETVVLADSGIQSRLVTIRDIRHKHVHRFQDCLNQYQVRFPGGTAIQMVHVGTGDKFDPTPIIKNLEERKQQIKELEAAYRSSPMPFQVFADLAARNEPIAWAHLVSNSDLGIRCFNGQSDGLRAGMMLAGKCKTMVLDLTALITLLHLEMLRVLRCSSRVYVVTQTTFDRLQFLVEQAEFDKQSGGSITLADDGSLGRTEITEDQREKRVAFLASVRDIVRETCQIRPCPQAAALDPKKRSDLTRALGRHNLDSLLIGSSPDTVLWTDDLILGALGKSDFQSQRVWTQAVLLALRKEGEISSAEFDRAVAKMVGWYYQGTQLDEDTLVAAAEIANWRMDHWPVPAAMRCLETSTSDPISRLRVAAQAIRAVWRRELHPTDRRAFLFATLGGLKTERLVRKLLAAVPKLFGVDILSADEVQAGIAAWLRAPTINLILP